MDVLKDLQAHAERAAGEAPARTPVPAAVEVAMETLFGALERVAKELNAVELDVPARYELTPTRALEGLAQEGYRVETLSVDPPRFRVAFCCVGPSDLAFTVTTVAERNQWRERLDGHRLDYQIENQSKWRYVVRVRARVPVSLTFEPHPAQPVVRVTARNLRGLGVAIYSIRPESLDKTLVNELAKMLARRPDRFAELSGNRVPEDVRGQFRADIEARRRARAHALKNPPTGARGRTPSMLIKLLGAARAADDHEIPLAPAPGPDALAPPSRAPSAEPPPASPPATAHTAVPPGTEARKAAAAGALPGYAWMITGDVVAGDTGASTGRVGPRRAVRRFPVRRIIDSGEPFRLRDRSGTVRYTGLIAGEYQGVEPLVDFGVDRGCLVIEYRRDGDWVRVRPQE